MRPPIKFDKASPQVAFCNKADKPALLQSGTCGDEEKSHGVRAAPFSPHCHAEQRAIMA